MSFTFTKTGFLWLPVGIEENKKEINTEQPINWFSSIPTDSSKIVRVLDRVEIVSNGMLVRKMQLTAITH